MQHGRSQTKKRAVSARAVSARMAHNTMTKRNKSTKSTSARTSAAALKAALAEVANLKAALAAATVAAPAVAAAPAPAPAPAVAPAAKAALPAELLALKGSTVSFLYRTEKFPLSPTWRTIIVEEVFSAKGTLWMKTTIPVAKFEGDDCVRTFRFDSILEWRTPAPGVWTRPA